MPIKRSRAAISVLASTVALFVSLCLAASASATCGEIIHDFTPGIHAISCHYESGTDETWTVPAEITEPTFTLTGADDELGGSGGFLSAKVAVTSGDEFHLILGGEGAASSVSRNGAALLIAEGGSGEEPNYVSPEAQLLASEEPGQPLKGAPLNGSITIEWYDRRPFFNLTEPLPEVIVDFFGGETTVFPYSEEKQLWTAPDGINRAAFELFGGPGESGEPRGHVFTVFKVKPGETFGVEVGGPGEDTTLYGSASQFDVVRAAGGDTERDNYLPFGASPAEEFWEGGGPDSEPGIGKALVHYWYAGQANEEPMDRRSELPARASVPRCVVPHLRGKRPRAVLRALARANCTLEKVHRRHSRRRMRGRVVRQSPRPGTVAAPRARVSVVLGAWQQ
jgi:hypothetical protein